MAANPGNALTFELLDRPSAAARKEEEGSLHPLSPGAFVEVVTQCGKARHQAVRALAAQALAAVAPLDNGVLVEELLAQIPISNAPMANQNLVSPADEQHLVSQ